MRAVGARARPDETSGEVTSVGGASARWAWRRSLTTDVELTGSLGRFTVPPLAFITVSYSIQAACERGLSA